MLMFMLIRRGEIQPVEFSVMLRKITSCSFVINLRIYVGNNSDIVRMFVHTLSKLYVTVCEMHEERD
jgi:hypothetical protein